MKSRFLLALIALASLQVLGQNSQTTPAVPALPSDPLAFFELAVPHYDFSDPKLKPWHLKASYEIYNYDGKLATKGTWEYWWASPKVRRRSWERPGLSRTDWITADGTIFRKDSGEAPLYFERRLEDTILYPGPNYEMIKAGDLKLGLKTAAPGSGNLSCLTVTSKTEDNGKPRVVPLSTPPNYCFDPETMALMGSYSNQSLSKYSQFVVMQDHYLARRVTVQVGRQAMINISVDAIDGIDENDPALNPPADAVPLPGSAHYTSDSPPPAKLAGGKPLKQVSPQIIGLQRLHGVIFSCVQIGLDGKVRRVEVLSTPSRLVADAIVDAAKQWEFEPLTVDGKPVEMEFPIVINTIP